MKLCLGTVQQGMEYGINNQYGKLSVEESLEIFHQAVVSGIDVFDTARAYGDAEYLIGEYFRRYGNANGIKIISKLRPNVFSEGDNFYDIMKAECQESLRRLGIDKLYGYLLHTPEYIRNSQIVEALCRLKTEGFVENIGVSIYEIEDGDYAIAANVDFVQLPVSVFDQRGITSGFIKRAKDAGIKIFARSAFLQGLFFMEETNLPKRVLQAQDVLGRWNTYIAGSEFTKAEAAIGFIKCQADIDYLVFGVDSVKQLKEDVDIFENYSLDEKAKLYFEKEFSIETKSIIIPSLWSNGVKPE